MLKIAERKRNRENGATDVHNVVGTNSKEEIKCNVLKKNLKNLAQRFSSFSPCAVIAIRYDRRKEKVSCNT